MRLPVPRLIASRYPYSIRNYIVSYLEYSIDFYKTQLYRIVFLELDKFARSVLEVFRIQDEQKADTLDNLTQHLTSTTIKVQEEEQRKV